MLTEKTTTVYYLIFSWDDDGHTVSETIDFFTSLIQQNAQSELSNILQNEYLQNYGLHLTRSESTLNYYFYVTVEDIMHFTETG